MPAEVDIEKGKIITISLDDEKTNYHFGDQAIHGTVSSLMQCNNTPGPEMQIPTPVAKNIFPIYIDPLGKANV